MYIFLNVTIYSTNKKLYKILLRFWPTWSHICVRFAGSMALTPINTMQCNDMQFKQRRLTTLPSSRSRYRYSTSTYIDPKKQQVIFKTYSYQQQGYTQSQYWENVPLYVGFKNICENLNGSQIGWKKFWDGKKFFDKVLKVSEAKSKYIFSVHI